MRRAVIVFAVSLFLLLFSGCCAGSREITRYESETFNAYVWVEGRDLAVVLVDRTLVVPTKRTVVPDSDALAQVGNILQTLAEVSESPDPISALIESRKALRKSPLVDTLAVIGEDSRIAARLRRIDTTTFLDLRGIPIEEDVLDVYLSDVRTYQMRRKTTQ
ncbi:MAG TPA: hypothetical protein PK909_04940 [Sphaerochaeta sp.]|jgi:hypothetical protein|nr:hypothetical protein [Spirochaetales bacterium]HPX28966.1 hypothetical protein [Sphaerochaeta sp.]HQB54805.1 hypothetical protein [Sphaerochaeta sp.]